MKDYWGIRNIGVAEVKVTEGSIEQGGNVTTDLDPQRSLKLRNHSPDGFAWGYAGSGPSQLALALLLDALPGNSDRLAGRLYQQFKEQFVSRWPEEGWGISQQEILDWVSGILTSEEIVI